MRISVFGATGSIGESTLDLVRRERERFDVVALSGGRNIARLAALAREFRPEIVVSGHADMAGPLRDALSGSGIAVACGPEALIEAAMRPSDLVMSAIIGAAGIGPGLACCGATKRLMLANKEALVCAGPLLRARAAVGGTELIPVDSEHSAVYQLLLGEDPHAINRVTLTASGGAFRDWPLAQLADATPEQAATHPNWQMGQRITIDSASLFNKALEVLEAIALFDLEPEQIEVVIHPESLVHALVSFQDGGIKAHLGAADMRHAIGFAMNYPERRALPVASLDLAAIGSLRFQPWDSERAPALRLAYEAARCGGMAGTVLNAAKEVALDAFISKQIGFLDMARLVEGALEAAYLLPDIGRAAGSLDDVTRWDRFARATARDAVAACAER